MIAVGLAWEGKNLWVVEDSLAEQDPRTIFKVDENGAVLLLFQLPDSCPAGLAYDGSHLWNADYCEGKIYEAHQDWSRPHLRALPGRISYGVTWDGQHLLVNDWNSLSKFTQSAAPTAKCWQALTPQGLSPLTGLPGMDHSLWASSHKGLYRLDAATGAVLDTCTAAFRMTARRMGCPGMGSTFGDATGRPPRSPNSRCGERSPPHHADRGPTAGRAGGPGPPKKSPGPGGAIPVRGKSNLKAARSPAPSLRRLPSAVADRALPLANPVRSGSGDDYTVRVKSTTKTSCSDTSDETFSITEANTIAATVPNGGEVWQAGSTHNITWSYNGQPGTSVKITLLKAACAPDCRRSGPGRRRRSGVLRLAHSSGPGAGQYKIKVASTKDTACTHQQRQFHYCGPPAPKITVTAPNGGEELQAGTTRKITWSFEGNSGPQVKIELLKRGLVNQIIAAGVALGAVGSGSYHWPISSTLPGGTDYQVVETCPSLANVSDGSDADFTILAAITPKITVLAPNGGEQWQAGTIQNITWKYQGDPGSKVKIELLQAGKVATKIAAAVPVGVDGNGFYDWQIPSSQTEAANYKVRITSTTNSSVKDSSNAPFSIVVQPDPGGPEGVVLSFLEAQVQGRCGRGNGKASPRDLWSIGRYPCTEDP